MSNDKSFMWLTNRRFFKVQDIEINRTTVHISKKGLFESDEYDVSLEQIHFRRRIRSSTNESLLVIAFAMILFGLLSLLGDYSGLSFILIIGGLLFFILALITKRKLVSIPTYTNEAIELYYNRQNKAEIVAFADAIIAASNNFLLQKYGQVDRSLPIDNQLNNLAVLREREIISEEEYLRLKNKLLGRDNASTLGFSRS